MCKRICLRQNTPGITNVGDPSRGEYKILKKIDYNRFLESSYKSFYVSIKYSKLLAKFNEESRWGLKDVIG